MLGVFEGETTVLEDWGSPGKAETQQGEHLHKLELPRALPLEEESNI